MPVVVDDRVELGEGKFRIRVLRAGEGEAVVFLHGAYGLNWDPFLDRLSSRFAVYAPEHPGAGDSEGVEHLSGIWDLVLYYYDLFDALGLRSPAVIGHSFGGMVAAEVAACNPERVKRLVLIDPIGLWRDDFPVADYNALPQEKLARLAFHDPEGPVARQTLALPEEPEARGRTLVRMITTLAATNQFVWPIPDKGLHKRLHRIKAPTLIIWGNEDGLVPPVYAQEFGRRISGARVERIDRAAHMPHLEQQERVSRLVADFLG